MPEAAGERLAGDAHRAAALGARGDEDRVVAAGGSNSERGIHNRFPATCGGA